VTERPARSSSQVRQRPTIHDMVSALYEVSVR